MLASLDRVEREAGVIGRRSCDDHGIDRGVGEHLLEARCDDAVGLRLLSGNVRHGIDDGRRRAERGMRAHVVATPCPATDHGHAHVAIFVWTIHVSFPLAAPKP
ncbi:MAG: hypothetical protein R2701_03450 [Acidimicrobiales bacterium]